MSEMAKKYYATGKKTRERVNAMKQEGHSEVEISDALGIQISIVRSIFFTNATGEGRELRKSVRELIAKGYSNAAIADKLNILESTIRLIRNHPELKEGE